jgi:murein DD-endopeptidase MepM/ murein hydrolase activator NlpD
MEEFVCRYPFDTKKYEVKILKPKGEFAHENFSESRYAVDFALPLGAPVLAVKKGVIILAKYDSDTHYSTTEVKDLTEAEKREIANRYTNIVGIKHNGVFTEYAHLAKNRVVSEEQSVEEGEVIGYIGRYGIIDLDHLHFNAFTNESNIVRSIPVRFIK